MKERVDFDIVVAGAGPAGLACALALALRDAFAIAVVAPAPPAHGRRDTRTAALFPGSVELMRAVGAWEGCRPAAEPLAAIRVVDAIGAPLAAPEVVFRSSEIGLGAFAWNVPNETLTEALREKARHSNVALVESAITGLSRDDGMVRVHLDNGRTLSGRLIIGADGRNSVCRASAGIATRAWSYDQSAIACVFGHRRPHGGVSTEFHTRAGPLTTVPMPGRASSLVWVERPAVAQRLARLDDAVFRAALEARLQGLLGTVGDLGPRATFPLSGMTAASVTAERLALVGEAGHVLPPIGAQGLNLGFRDGAALADAVHDAAREGRDIGGPEALAVYARSRAADVASRVFAVGALNRTLLASNLVPVHLARGLGLFAVKAIGPLRRGLMREGLEPPGSLPRLMRPTSAAMTA